MLLVSCFGFAVLPQRRKTWFYLIASLQWTARDNCGQFAVIEGLPTSYWHHTSRVVDSSFAGWKLDDRRFVLYSTHGSWAVIGSNIV